MAAARAPHSTSPFGQRLIAESRTPVLFTNHNTGWLLDHEKVLILEKSKS